MFICYKIDLENDCLYRGIINSDHITHIEIEEHGGGYGKAITVNLLGEPDVCIFMGNNEKIFERIYCDFIEALNGVNSPSGYFRVIKTEK